MSDHHPLHGSGAIPKSCSSKGANRASMMDLSQERMLIALGSLCYGIEISRW